MAVPKRQKKNIFIKAIAGVSRYPHQNAKYYLQHRYKFFDGSWRLSCYYLFTILKFKKSWAITNITLFSNMSKKKLKYSKYYNSTQIFFTSKTERIALWFYRKLKWWNIKINTFKYRIYFFFYVRIY